MQDINQIIQSIVSGARNKISQIPPVEEQVRQISSLKPDQIQKQAMDLAMAGTVQAPKMIGNNPKIAGTLLDVAQMSKLKPADQIEAIKNMQSLVAELLPKQAKSKAMNTLSNQNVDEWMAKMAQLLIKKTGVYPGMAP